MMKNNRILSDQSGMALVVALVVLLSLTVLGISAMTTSTIDVQIASNERRVAEALYLAGAGIERAILDLTTDFEEDSDWSNADFWNLTSSAAITNGNQVNTALSSTDPDNYGDFPFDDEWGDQWGTGSEEPFTVIENDSVTVGGAVGNAVAPYGVETLGDGKYLVLLMRESGEDDEVYVRSYALHDTGARKILQVHLDVDEVDAWRNALFAGSGQGGSVIQGNVWIAGPIHILGTGEEDISLAMSGNAGVMNGYKRLDTAIKDRIHDSYIETTTREGSEVETLETAIRVKKGTIDLGGTAKLGETGAPCSAEVCTDTATDDYQSKLDIVLANDGIANGIGKVHAYEIDEFGGYDLGDKVQMPALKDSYDGQTDSWGRTCGDIGETCVEYEDYVELMSIDLPDDRCGLVPYKNAGDAGTTAFYNGTWAGAPGFSDCTDPNGCIYWDNGDPLNNNPGWNPPWPTFPGDDIRLVIDGRIKFSDACGSPLQFGRSGAYDIEYIGKGILYTSKSIGIDGSMISEDSGGTEYFLVDHLMAVLSKNDIEIGTSANVTVMGAFYAEDTVSSDKNNMIVGSVMANFFDFGSGQAADIYYVDKMSKKLREMGMLHSDRVYTFRTFDWSQETK